MSSLRDLRRRIRSTEHIKQITKTMEMVAGARLRRAQAKAEQARPYAAKMNQMVENLAQNDDAEQHPLFAKREIKKTGVVVVAADRGLCGSYNTHIFNVTDRFLKNYTKDNVELILLGRKAVGHYRHRHWKIKHELSEWGGKITFAEIKNLTNQLVDWFLDGELDEIWIVYTHYINVFSRNTVIEKFLNIESPKKADNTPKLDYIYEPDAKEIFDDILPRYCISRIQTALNEAYASELAARIVSMRAATKNADEMITRLTLKRNKIRQAGITKEMIEIVSGQQRD